MRLLQTIPHIYSNMSTQAVKRGRNGKPTETVPSGGPEFMSDDSGTGTTNGNGEPTLRLAATITEQRSF